MGKQAMMGGRSSVMLNGLSFTLLLNPPQPLGDTLHIAHMPSVSRIHSKNEMVI